MDVHAYSPESGGSGSAHSAQPQKKSSGPRQLFSDGSPPAGLAINWPSQKEALGLYEFFYAGTKKDVVLLGEGVEVVVHHVRSKKHKMPCTRSTGSCEYCQVCATSLDVGDPQTEVHYPAMRKDGKDRRHHQCIAVFTLKQNEELVEPLASEEGARGLRIEVTKVNAKTAQIKTIKGSPRSRAASLPEAFELLPWARGRWILPQDPEHPPERLEPFTIRDSERTGRQLKPLGLTATDRMPAEEQDKVQAKMAEMRSRFLTPSAPAPAPQPEPERPAPAPVAPPEYAKKGIAAEVAPPVPAGSVEVPPVAPPPPPTPLPTTPEPVIGAGTLSERTEAHLVELEQKHLPVPSTGMVPSAGLAIAAQRNALMRQRNAEGRQGEIESREDLLRRARNGENLGNDRAEGLGGALDTVISGFAKGGAK